MWAVGESCPHRVTGFVWVALRVPDGYISAHANQARVTAFVTRYKPQAIGDRRQATSYKLPSYPLAQARITTFLPCKDDTWQST